MSTDNQPTSCARNTITFIGVAGSILIAVFLVRAMVIQAPAPGLNTQRAAERSKALAELRAAATEAQNNYGWVDQNKGVVRLPIARAMELLQAQTNSAAFRSNLIARVEKATAVPPKAPEKPSQFE